MIQFNLLPDVKLEYIKAERSKRLIIGISLVVSAAAIAVLVLLISLGALQKKHLNDLSRDIKNESASLQSKPDINHILTVQNQLESLTGLHNSKPAADRLFGYLNNVTPANVAINNLAIDFTQDTMTISGTSDSLSSVNKYVDTLKLTTYSTSTNTTVLPAFSNVVLSTFGLSTATQDPSQAANYGITLSFDKNIFDITQTINPVNLSVPPVTTRAQVPNPTDLFKAPANGGTK